jgi:hypothetical protein
MVDGNGETLFPAAQSPAGRVLAHLVSLEIPGTSVEISLDVLGRAASLTTDETVAALRHLHEERFVVLEGTPDAEQVSATVLLAPPLEEYGITARWGIPAEATANGSAADTDGATGASTETPTPGAMSAAAPRAPRARPPAVAKNAQAEVPAKQPLPMTLEATPAIMRRGGATQGRLPRGARAAGVTELPGVSEPQKPVDASPPPPAAGAPDTAADDSSPAPAAPGGRSTRGTTARRTGSGATVDETAVLRGFVERFEQLLGELEEWKNRARSAEERLTTTEKLLRDAERRAETAEVRLTAAEERAQEWAELTKRMQQLARQADSGVRSRISGVRSKGDGA